MTAVRWVAFLRAINVGGHKVRMDRLREIFAAAGFGPAETFLASGNVIFAGPGDERAVLESALEAELEDALGYGVATFLRTPAEIAGMLAHRPFADLPELEPAKLHVALLKRPPAEDLLAAAAALETPDDRFELRGSELYWLAGAGLGRSAVSGAVIERVLKGPVTVRGSNTLRRLAARYPAR